PMVERMATGSSIVAQPRTEGPTTMPSVISRTTDGTRSHGTNPITKGARNETPSTTARLVNDTPGMDESSRRRGRVAPVNPLGQIPGWTCQLAPAGLPGAWRRRRLPDRGRPAHRWPVLPGTPGADPGPDGGDRMGAGATIRGRNAE